MAMPTRPDWAPRFAIFGDMGNVNTKSVGRLEEETQEGNFDAILHVGMFTADTNSDKLVSRMFLLLMLNNCSSIMVLHPSAFYH